MIATNSALTFADGMAVRVPDPTALEVIRKGAERIVEVSDDEMPIRGDGGALARLIYGFSS